MKKGQSDTLVRAHRAGQSSARQPESVLTQAGGGEAERVGVDVRKIPDQDGQLLRGLHALGRVEPLHSLACLYVTHQRRVGVRRKNAQLHTCIKLPLLICSPMLLCTISTNGWLATCGQCNTSPQPHDRTQALVS